MKERDQGYARIEEIVRSGAGERAAIEAMDRGEPALSGVDALLREQLGDDYMSADRGPHLAAAMSPSLCMKKGFEGILAARAPRAQSLSPLSSGLATDFKLRHYPIFKSLATLATSS